MRKVIGAIVALGVLVCAMLIVGLGVGAQSGTAAILGNQAAMLGGSASPTASYPCNSAFKYVVYFQVPSTFWICDGSAWVQPPPGPTGATGAPGPTGATGSTGATGANGTPAPTDFSGTATLPAAVLIAAGCSTAVAATISGVTSAQKSHRVDVQLAAGGLPTTNVFFQGGVTSSGAVMVQQCSTLALSLSSTAVTVIVGQ